MPPVISINGHLHSAHSTDATLSPFDRGFTLGDALFETMKLVDGTVWYLTRHLVRLQRAMGQLEMPYPDRLPAWIEDVIHAVRTREHPREHASEAIVRVTVSRGVALAHGLAGDTTTSPTVTIMAFDPPASPSRLSTSGITVQIASAPRNERARTANLKTTNYLETILALRSARAAGYDDALFLNTRGEVAELSASNCFIVTNDTLVTPPIEAGILPGITRDVVQEIAASQGIRIETRPVSVDDLLHANEAFGTSSLRGLVPIVRVDHTPIGDGTPGARTQQLMHAYAVAPTRI